MLLLQKISRLLVSNQSTNKVLNHKRAFKHFTWSTSIKNIPQRNLIKTSVVTGVFNRNSQMFCHKSIHLTSYSTTTIESPESIDQITFERVCDETLESLSEYFEEVIESAGNLQNSDVSYSSGVLTIALGEQFGTYVINRQSPNKQIWLSSPTSGPKRYEFLPDRKQWYYKYDKQTLHELLQLELSKIIEGEVDFKCCSFS